VTPVTKIQGTILPYLKTAELKQPLILLLAHAITNSPCILPKHSINRKNLRPLTVTVANVINYSWGHVTPVTFSRFCHFCSFGSKADRQHYLSSIC